MANLPLDLCMQSLHGVIDAYDDGKVEIAERAIDRYMATVAAQAQTSALNELEQRVRALVNNNGGSTVLAYIDHWRRRIAKMAEDADGQAC